MLTIKKLTKAHAGRTLFRETEMTINWGERVALVGPNGAGKSTLFRMILREDTPDEGSISLDEYAIVGYLPQEASEPKDETVLEIAMGITPEMERAIHVIRMSENANKTDTPEYAEAIDTFNAANGYQLEPKAKKILKGLAFRESDFHRPAREMSGGWIMRAYLAKLLVLEPDLLMLDEPTNHLDLLSLLWLQRYLKNYPGAILMISHDRDFMDELVESVYDIDNEELVEYRGNYTDFLKQRDVRFEQLQAAYRNQQKEIAHIQEFIDRFRSINSKAGQVQSRIKQLEKMKVIQKPVARRKVFKFNFPQPPRSTQKVIELEKVCQSYGDHKVYENLDLLVERGERTVLVGPNGAGKSTLLKILAGIIPIDSGKRIPGTTTRIGYFSQARTENLNPENTVLEEIMKCNAEIREEEARSILGSFLFRRLDVEKRVSVLSGGEKSRLSLVKFLVDPPNLLLMDEPTTHLDLLSVEALVQALKHYEGTLVFISHDVHFIRSLAEKTLHGQMVIPPHAVNTYALPAAGRVTFHVKSAQQVRKGQLLYTLASPDIVEMEGAAAQAKAELNRGIADLAALKERRDTLEKIGTKNSELNTTIRFKETEEESLKAALKASENKLKLATASGELKDNLLYVYAAADGSVQSVDMTQGAWGEQGAPALVMTNKGELEFATTIYGADPVHYAKAQLALTRGKNTELLDGSLRVADQVDPATQSRALYFTPDRLPEGTHAGQLARLDLYSRDSATDGFIPVPNSAVVKVGVNDVVFIKTGEDAFVMKKVQILPARQGKTPVKGLIPGQTIVTKGGYELKYILPAEGSGSKKAAGHFHADGQFHEGEH